jgi:hypothetical protein
MPEADANMLVLVLVAFIIGMAFVLAMLRPRPPRC